MPHPALKNSQQLEYSVPASQRTNYPRRTGQDPPIAKPQTPEPETKSQALTDLVYKTPSERTKSIIKTPLKYSCSPK